MSKLKNPQNTININNKLAVVQKHVKMHLKGPITALCDVLCASK